jgi:hypothetical protein
MAGKLAPSLSRLFAEINFRWPNRDHRTDGWYADPNVRTSLGHNPGHNGYSHAIDVDDDGIDEIWIINNIRKDDKVLWYIIWNRTLYSNTYNWKPRAYTGSNPHTDHMHIEIYQTTYAETWTGAWGIKPVGSKTGPDVEPPDTSTPGGTYGGDFGVDYGGRNYRGFITGMAGNIKVHADYVNGSATSMRNLRS